MSDKFKEFIEERVRAQIKTFEELAEATKKVLDMNCLGCKYMAMATQEAALNAFTEVFSGMHEANPVLSPIIHAIIPTIVAMSDSSAQEEINNLEEIFKRKGPKNEKQNN
jgi:hypothetical protein